MTHSLVIIGAGISGLTAAMKLLEQGLEDFIVVDYQSEIGGFIKRYIHSPEFSDEREVLSKASQVDLPVHLNSTVVGFFPGEDGMSHQLFVQTANGIQTLEARRVLLAAGALEKPREAHKIPGSRPAGVMTPYMALELISRGYQLGQHVAVYDNGRIARSALMQLKQAHDHVTVIDSSTEQISGLSGVERLQSINCRHRVSGVSKQIDCDTLLFAQGRYPATFFLKGVSIETDASAAVLAKPDGKTNAERVYAAGSCTVIGDDQHLNSSRQAKLTADQIMQSLQEDI